MYSVQKSGTLNAKNVKYAEYAEYVKKTRIT